VLNERHLLRLLTHDIEQYDRCRPHRSLDLTASVEVTLLRHQTGRGHGD